MPTVTLPPWLRRIQQSWYFQLILQPILVGALPIFIGCAGMSMENLSIHCVKLSLGAGLIALLIAFQHSTGSASFKPDGTPNEAVEKVVAANKAGETVIVSTQPVTPPVVQPAPEKKP